MEAGLMILVLFPFMAGILVYFISNFGKDSWGIAEKREKIRNHTVILAAVLEFMGMVLLAVMSVSRGEQVLYLELPDICGLGISFVLEGFRVVYGCIVAFMWMMASIFSIEYFRGHKNQSRFFVFWLWTLGATMGVFLSADLFTTFLFFEIMSFTSYVWVAQEENRASLRAAGTYLAVAVMGGLVMLMGLFLLWYHLGTLAMGQLAQASMACDDKNMLYVAGLCLLFGFGAKAGMFPLHIWLPKAHPVAPAPASALLSGILTKTGIYGILIVSCNLFPCDFFWGSAVLTLGVLTMFGGAFLAVFSIDLKRTLACSSMSQIGFILVGIGVLGLSGAKNPAYNDMSVGNILFFAPDMLAVHGIMLHMINHSLIKLVLFLAAGAIHKNVHSMDLNVIRGFGRGKYLLAGCFLIGALAIGGVPMFGGYISKTLLHESIVEYGGGSIMTAVEWIFLLSGGLTVAYMTKLFVAVFVEKNQKEEQQKIYDEMKGFGRFSTVFSVAGSALVLLVWGFFPHGVMEKAARLGENFFYMAQGQAAAYIPAETMAGEGTHHNIMYFSPENLKGGLISILIGAAVYLFFVRKKLMEREGGTGSEKTVGRKYVNLWPAWLDLEELLYRPVLLKLLPAVFGVLCRIPDSLADGMTSVLRRTIFRNSPLPRERMEGNAFTERVGKALNLAQSIGNRTWHRKKKAHRDYVHLAAMKHAEFKENNLIIRRSLSFGLLLFCVGLTLTLMYLIWW